MKTKDFDRFMAEREDEKMKVRILGRDVELPAELPWEYVMKVERMLRTGEPISGRENIDLMRRMLDPEDYEYITRHPDFRASWFWEIIAFAWLRSEGASDDAPRFRCEDDVKAEETQVDVSKKARSARSACGRTSRLTFSGNTAST